ncbi:MAG TPA: SPFH domain-containing protein, partial [Candidatus Ozemobacteraceae bacterium]|nr:SPFH domain-containing protein [Candidatus Ozemobacteraceae bacterium]
MTFNRYLIGIVLVILFMVMTFASALYHTFFVYVPADKMLIIISKSGEELPAGQVIASRPEQKGIWKDPLGEGRHFVMPYLYETQLKDVVTIKPGQVGVVTSRVGKTASPGAILVNDDEIGIWRRVLTPGKYRLNPYAYKVDIHPAVAIQPGFVGFVTSLVGREADGMFAGDGEKGIRKNVLHPGLYFINPYEFKVTEVEVGVNQESFLDENQITFPSKDAFSIAVEATVEWELLPEHVAQVMSEFGGPKAVVEKIIVPQSKSIGRIQGSSYSAKEFLLGVEREKFQKTFTLELERICEAKNITIHSAFIRNLSIPDSLLTPIREAFVAVEQEKTAKVWEDTRKSAMELEREQARITQRRQQVIAETQAAIRTIEAETAQEVGKIEASTRLEVANVEQQIALIEAEKTKVLGEAQATVAQLEGEAKSKGLESKIRAFGDNPSAYVNYSFARRLPDDLKLQLIYSGEGTLWTDLQ